MSNFGRAQITCTCGTSYPVRTVLSLHGSSRPDDRARILAGTFQEHSCPRCERITIVESRFLYTDFGRGHYIVVEPPDVELTPALVVRHARVFRRCFERTSPIAAELGARLRRRIVRGLVGLREKLWLWDAGLDDLVVESLKADVLARFASFGIGGLTAYVLDPAGDALVLGVHAGFPARAPRPSERAPGQVATITIPRERYEARAADREAITRTYPLADDWVVDASTIRLTELAKGMPHGSHTTTP